MNNPTQQFKQMTKRLFKAKSGSPHVKILHPTRDWLVGIVVAVCIVIGITTWNGYTYFINRDGGTTDTEIIIANPRYQAELVDQALTVFETRNSNFIAIIGNTPPVSDSMVESPITETSTTTATSTPDMSEGVAQEPEAQNSEADQTVEESTATELEPISDSVPEQLGTPQLSQ